MIQLQSVKEVPTESPINLPSHQDDFKWGTKSMGLLEMENLLSAKENQICLNAMKERDRLESIGFGDQLTEMH